MPTPEPAAEIAAPSRVRTRRVHYISGFDPRGARYYHRLYREEAAAQAPLLGTSLEVGDRRKISPHVSAWTVTGDWEGEKVATDYQFMVWDDFVRENWESGGWKILGLGIRFYVKFVQTDWFRRILQASKGAFYTSVMPICYFLLWAILSLLLIVVGGWITTHFTGSWLAALLVVAGLFYFACRKGLQTAERRDVLWVLRAEILFLVWSKGSISSLETRIDEMVEWITRQQQIDPADEVLIVGHSIGSLLAASVVARILQKNPGSLLPPNLALLTIGQCILYVSPIPGAGALRQDLEVLGRDDRIPWIDADSMPDPMCFFQVDPIRASRVESHFQHRPKQIVVRIFRMFSPAVYAKMRRNKLRIHFQYLMASEIPVDYDYFKITAGPCQLPAQPYLRET